MMVSDSVHRSWLFGVWLAIVLASNVGCGIDDEPVCRFQGEWGVCTWDKCEVEGESDAWLRLRPANLLFACASSWDCEEARWDMWEIILAHCNPNLEASAEQGDGS